MSENIGTYTIGSEYWVGWVLAYYRWLTRRSFAYMRRKGLDIKEVVSMYYPLHEADLSMFADAANSIVQNTSPFNSVDSCLDLTKLKCIWLCSAAPGVLVKLTVD